MNSAGAAAVVFPPIRPYRDDSRTNSRRGILRAPHETTSLPRSLLHLTRTTNQFMSRVFVFLFLCGVATSSSATMSRVVSIQDSRTILVEFAGRRSVVVLTGVAVVAADEASAAGVLSRVLVGRRVQREYGED